jgi:putative tributyrin esterase
VPHLTYRYKSEALEKHVQAEVLLPDPKVAGPWHVMFLLHGLSDDQTIWMRRTSIERHVDGLPLIVVMPDGGRGWYSDAIQGYAYGTAIGEELPDLIRNTFPTRAPWAISGLSMGGYGALKLALRYPETFHSAVSHSGALEMARRPPHRGDAFDDEALRIFGEDSAGGENDLFALVGKLRPSKMPLLRFDCGTDDFLIESNRAFDRHLQGLEVGHQYQEFSGGHDWGYWDEHVREGIAFHCRNLGI